MWSAYFNRALVGHVLRKVEDRSEQEATWRVMGDAYVHELMYGEADEMIRSRKGYRAGSSLLSK
jgi:hypothetical protein